MDLQKFEILSSKTGQSLHLEKVQMLINLDHIISVKPIRIIITDNIIDGYWIRTSNGKKYKASKIPSVLAQLLAEQELDHHLNYSDHHDLTESSQEAGIH